MWKEYNWEAVPCWQDEMAWRSIVKNCYLGRNNAPVAADRRCEHLAMVLTGVKYNERGRAEKTHVDTETQTRTI